jgi:hypothetical protein
MPAWQVGRFPCEREFVRMIALLQFSAPETPELCTNPERPSHCTGFGKNREKMGNLEGADLHQHTGD